MKTVFRLTALLLLFGVISCSAFGEAPGNGLDVKLEMAKAPALNEPVVVTTTVKAAQDTAARVYLNFFSAKVEIVNGSSEWNIDLKQGVPATFTTTLKFVEEREHIIDALASGKQGMHGGASIRVYVTRTGGTFDIPVPTVGPRPLPTPTYPDLTPRHLTPSA
jgi:hypothetical protein